MPHFTVEAKDSQNNGLKRENRLRKKTKTISFADKVMASISWDARGIIFIDYLEKEKTMNSEYYAFD